MEEYYQSQAKCYLSFWCTLVARRQSLSLVALDLVQPMHRKNPFPFLCNILCQNNANISSCNSAALLLIQRERDLWGSFEHTAPHFPPLPFPHVFSSTFDSCYYIVLRYFIYLVLEAGIKGGWTTRTRMSQHIRRMKALMSPQQL